jgi:hypothetical protein
MTPRTFIVVHIFVTCPSRIISQLLSHHFESDARHAVLNLVTPMTARSF